MLRTTQVPSRSGSGISHTGLSPSPAPLSSGFRYPSSVTFADGPTTPRAALRQPRFGLLRVRSPLLAQSLLFSFPPGIEMFQFPGFAPHSVRWHGRPCRVAPFGNPRVMGYLLLTAAYRSLSRPSSPPRAKASFMCPSLLSFFFKESRLFTPSDCRRRYIVLLRLSGAERRCILSITVSVLICSCLSILLSLGSLL